jgi:ATP-dependent DNA helicase UvrD/PcrA
MRSDGGEATAEDLLTGLDSAQRHAVTCDDLPLCIVAGAGSGKTRVLTRRIAWRAATGREDPRRVLALTFTRTAATELAVRLRALGVREPIRAGTFHAVAWAELRDRWSGEGRAAPALLERPERIVARVVDTDRRTVDGIATELAWARARLVDPDDYPAAAADAGRRPPVPAERLRGIAADYAREKRRRGVVDFDDLLALLADAMERDAELAAAQRWRFEHLYVDEVQDLNPLQLRLLEAWRGGRPTLCCVGDPNQAIFAWNGSDPSLIERFEQRIHGAAVVAIRTSYRSTPQILAVANGILDAGRLGGVRLTAMRPEGPVPIVHRYADGDDEAVGVARAVVDGRLPGAPWSHQAVLARTNRQLESVGAVLEAAGVPVRRDGRGRFVDRPVVRAALRELGTAGADLTESMARLSSTVDELAGHADVDPDALDPDVAVDVAALRRLVALADEYRRATAGSDAAGFRSWLVANRDDAEGGDAVSLVTFHGAKGLEWPRVHVVGLEAGLVPLARATTAEAEAEERRLFYVAVTRAADVLHLSWASTRGIGGARPRARRPSPYLVELAPVLRELVEDAQPADGREHLAAMRAALAARRADHA